MSALSEELKRTARSLAAMQAPDGSIPWEPGRHVDPWDHVEAAMGLDVAGDHAAARRAYAWLAETQRSDGAWAAAYIDGRVFDATLDANFCAYVATGLWFHHLCRPDRSFLDRSWPMLERAMDFVLGLQAPSGEIYWARDATYVVWLGALLTSSSCIYLSLRSALSIASELGEERPDWELAATCLREAVRERPSLFEPKQRYSMDWYYPVLAGALTGSEARAHLAERWPTFVVEGWGCLCVESRPWVTTGETCELILACLASGLRAEAEDLFGWIQRLRSDDDLYWTGINLPDRKPWPVERTSWSAASVLLAADALEHGPAARLFSPEDRSVRAESVIALPEFSELPELP
jgi:hypothetical protein